VLAKHALELALDVVEEVGTTPSSLSATVRRVK